MKYIYVVVGKGKAHARCDDSVWYSMDGTVDPPRVILETIDEVFPADNANLVIDEVHATGLYLPGGRGMVALLGLVDCVLARLPTLDSPRGA
jgi:8-amino-7-oxononanoate synthase